MQFFQFLQIHYIESYLVATPLVNILSTPSGFGARTLAPVLSAVLLKVLNNTSSVESSPQKAVALLTLFYVFAVYVLSAIMSAMGQLLGNKMGYKNEEPCLNKCVITCGIPHQMIATHEALYNIFPAYAVAAALFACTSTGPSAPTALNALSLYIFLKLFVYVPEAPENVKHIQFNQYLIHSRPVPHNQPTTAAQIATRTAATEHIWLHVLTASTFNR
ncbi:hypothetical protein DFH08DRAFT_815295 [Mycena albidolilacea]|uniref:Uncharacterized protein n=1 Tax=Mycena albidolilacea TaxID=1033008 RepID=A0AAD6ZMY9_9AGAR|nr:hypothetical protein DFH08DRAFT_815295 [Mycena albidolilacea]